MLKWNPDERIRLEELKVEVDALYGEKKSFLPNEITIKLINNKCLTLDISNETTVLDLFLKIKDKNGNSIIDTFLCINNRVLKQKDFFKKTNEFGIKAGSRLDLIL